MNFGFPVETSPTAPPIYIPTVESPNNYRVVAVERKVEVEPSVTPPKDPKIIELEAS